MAKRMYDINVKEIAYGRVSVEAETLDEALELAAEEQANGNVIWAGGYHEYEENGVHKAAALPEKIVVPTVFGNIVAEQSSDPTYPGIHIVLEELCGKETQIALVEATPYGENGRSCVEHIHTLRLLAWEDEEREDYTKQISLRTRCNFDVVSPLSDALIESLKEVAAYVAKTSAENTESGNYITYPEEIPPKLISEELYLKHLKDVVRFVLEHESVAECEIGSESELDVMMYTSFCPNVVPLPEEETISVVAYGDVRPRTGGQYTLYCYTCKSWVPSNSENEYLQLKRVMTGAQHGHNCTKLSDGSIHGRETGWAVPDERRDKYEVRPCKVEATDEDGTEYIISGSEVTAPEFWGVYRNEQDGTQMHINDFKIKRDAEMVCAAYNMSYNGISKTDVVAEISLRKANGIEAPEPSKVTCGWNENLYTYTTEELGYITEFMTIASDTMLLEVCEAVDRVKESEIALDLMQENEEENQCMTKTDTHH